MGRYKEFDREAVLHKAMLVFWKKGYEAASIPDLLKAMDLSRSSLYETFGDKQTLYIEAINQYKKWKQAKRDILVHATSAKSGIRQYFELHIDSALDAESPKGCFITNAAVGMDSPDEQLNALIRERFDELEKAFYELLRNGQETGEISPDKDIKTLSYLLLNLNHSINIVAKVQGDRSRIRQMMDTVMEML
ncbi:TetR/AcrR family transcriptional regulator [Paenibacillus silviterrae]|uniref:TetR/AcrR family transcriptional regulator n=1 Tax=Paenibacillus silviterrae TaxID=3242194 RepID=UPI002543333D|nr:TetR/AcrR family transcriptional regulator [Paenibacillus chinjuensis]